jgi:chromosomal replication initiation ATPase DnaA
LNPIRANIVKILDEYVWSSHRAYLGQDDITWLTTEYGLSKFGKTISEAKIFYSSYISEIETNEQLAELRSSFKDGQVLGENDFLSEIRKINCIELDNPLSLNSILEAVCCILEIKKDMIISPSKSQSVSYARGMVASIAKKKKISFEEVAHVMKRDGSTISSLVSRFSLRYSTCLKTKNLIEKVISKALQIAELQA